jgi:hypothetical protein
VERGCQSASQLARGRVGLDEAKSRPIRENAVHIGITDVIVHVGPKLHLHLGESMLQGGEIHGDVMRLPEALLILEEAV